MTDEEALEELLDRLEKVYADAEAAGYDVDTLNLLWRLGRMK